MKTLLFLATLFSLFTITAQRYENVEDSQFKINIINPGIDYEFAIGDNQTLDFSAGLAFGYSYSLYFGSEYAFVPGFKGQYRYYYNYNRRRDKGKQISRNSANYIAVSSRFYISEVVIGNVEYDNGFGFVIGPVYGIQRTYKKGFNFGVEFGVGYYSFKNATFNSKSGGVSGTINFTIGWVLGSKKKK